MCCCVGALNDDFENAILKQSQEFAVIDELNRSDHEENEADNDNDNDGKCKCNFTRNTRGRGKKVL